MDKGERTREDRTFFNNKGATSATSSTSTSARYLKEGESKDKLREWLKKVAVRSTDQRRMLQAITNTFPTNSELMMVTQNDEGKLEGVGKMRPLTAHV